MRTTLWLKWSAIYFACVFGVGFILGPIRVLLLEPRFGVRIAELIEAPFMLATITIASRWVGGSIRAQLPAPARLGVGLLAAGCVLAADLAVGIGLRSMSALEVFTDRDPVSGTVYYALVALTAVAPWWFSRSSR